MKKNNIRRMTGIAMLMALIIVLQFLGSVLTSASGFSISLVLIPIVIGAAVYGPKAGAFLGAVFGVITMINCVTGADPGGHMVFQASPALCFLVVIVKATLAGWVAGLVYRLLKGKSEFVAMLGAAIVCPVVNTGIFIACMLLFFADILSSWAVAFGSPNVLGYILSGLILLNFVPELIINIVFGLAGQGVIKAISRK